MSGFLFTPKDGVAADFIPFFHEGVFRLFYLHDYRDAKGHGEGVPWYLLSTRDLVAFEPPVEVLERGGALEQDLFVFTGSVIEKDGCFHIFYTGHNPALEKNGCVQGVMHATSTDLLHWEKKPKDTFFADGARFEKHDWRDPFVFYNEEAGEYWMLLAARLRGGAVRRRGCTALCASKDLLHWEVREPLWAPGLYYTHECPDLFYMNGWWYLIFSEFSDDTKTRYRMARSLEGPWLKPADDAFDTRAYYAAKSVEANGRRYLFGWLSTREGNSDRGAWQWGGTLVVHELCQEPDGTLSVRIPGAIEAMPGKKTDLLEGETLQLRATHSGYDQRLYADMPAACRVELALEWPEAGGEVGVLLCSDQAGDRQYMLRLDRGAGVMRLDAFERRGDEGNMALLSRPADLGGPHHKLTLLVDGTALVAYLDGKVALSGRLYETANRHWGLYAQETDAAVSTLTLTDLQGARA